MFEGHVVGRSEQEVDMLRHDNERVNSKPAFASISIEGLQKKACVVLDNEQPSALPCRERNEISSGRGDESSWLQEQTSAAKAAIFA
jgi:hypothetical protein